MKKSWVSTKLLKNSKFREAFKQEVKKIKEDEIEVLTKIILHAHATHDYPCFKCRTSSTMGFSSNNRNCLCEKVEKWCRFVAKRIIKKSQP